ncbi:MAG: NUDIX hydrolase [Candidatus Saccharibacteria bacterium]
MSGPVQWGESIEQTARAELRKQTGLSADFVVRSFCRTADIDSNGTLLEDKLFAVVAATDVRGLPDTPWAGGINRWMTLAELVRQEKYFPVRRMSLS